jgi:hypothetical protein
VGWYLGYRAVQNWYAPLINQGTTVTYAMGEIVPIGPEPNVLKPEELDGYCYRVNSSRIVDTDTFLQESKQEDPWEEKDIKPEKLLLVSVTVINEGNLKKDFNLFQFDIKGRTMVGIKEEDQLAAAINPELKDNALPLALGDEATVTIPFGLYQDDFSTRSWRNLEEYPFSIYCHVQNKGEVGWETRSVPLT